jgi:hypothetical protein
MVFKNDIDYVCCGNTTLQLFADDAKLYSKVNVDNASSLLQQSVDRLANWVKEWQLTVNNNCAVVSLSSSSHTTIFTYFIDGIAVPRHNSYVELGSLSVAISHFTNTKIILFQRLGNVLAFFVVGSFPVTYRRLLPIHPSSYGI